MSPYPFAAGGIIAATTVAEVVTTTQNTGLVAPLIGAIASIFVAAIAAYAVIRQRRRTAPEEINALAVARTVEANLSSLRGELIDRIDTLTNRVDTIEDHVRPWPKAPQS